MTLGRPTLPEGCFVISAKSEEELSAGARANILWLGVGAGLSILAGGALLIVMALS